MLYLKEDQWKSEVSKKWLSILITRLEKDRKERVAMALADLSLRYHVSEEQDINISK